MSRILLAACGVALVMGSVSGCGWAEAEKARLDAERARLEAERQEQLARLEADRAAEELKKQAEKTAADLQTVAAQVTAVIPPRADNPVKNPPRDTAANPNQLHVFEGHEDAVTCLSFSPDNRKIASGSADGTVRVWDVKSKKDLASFKGHKGEVLAVTFGDDGHPISVGVDKTVRFWNPEARTREPVHLDGHEDKITCAAFSPTSERLVTGSLDKTAIVWELPGGKKLCICEGHSKGVLSVCFDSGGEVVMTGGQDGRVFNWAQSGYKAISSSRTNHGGWVTGVLFWSKAASTWSIHTGTNGLISFRRNDSDAQTVDPRCGALHCLDIFREGGRLATGGEDGIVRLYKLDSFNNEIKETVRLEGHTDAVKCVVTSPDGKLIASGGADKTVRLWQAP